MNTDAASPICPRRREARDGFRLCLVRTDLIVLMVPVNEGARDINDGARDDDGDSFGKEAW